MRRLVPLLALGLMASAFASVEAGAQREASGGPFLYEVRGAGAPSYLFGTFHLGVTLEEALPPPHHRTLLGARKVVTEMDVAALDPQAMMQGAVLPAGESLRAMMPASTWDSLARELGGTMPAMLLDRLRPWVPLTILAETRIARLGGSANAEPMDGRITREARGRGAEVAFLETADQQLSIMNSVPSSYFVHELRDLLDPAGEGERELREVLTAYRRGDERAMRRLIFDPEDMREMPEYYERLFVRRNRAWKAILLPELRGEGGLFVAVGLGHLLGEDGLCSALRAEGLHVRRVGAARGR